MFCFEINEKLEKYQKKDELIKWLEENDIELHKILQKETYLMIKKLQCT